MSVCFGLRSEAGLWSWPHRLALAWPHTGVLGVLLLVLFGAGSAWGQTVPPAKPKTQARAAKVQARKSRASAIRAAPTTQESNARPPTSPRRAALPLAKPGQRPGSAPTSPVRHISPDPRDPMGPPPPGVRNTGQSRIPGASHKPVPDTLAPGGTSRLPGTAPTDTAGLANGVSRTGDSLQIATKRKGAMETTINYTAKDSMQFDVVQKTARIYNRASVTYGETDLKAALITVNYGSNTMQADGKMDTVTHKLIGRPVLKDKGGLYTAGSIAYNFKSKKAKVTEAVTTQGEGFVSASVIKRMPDGDINGLLGRYTTCNLEHPHFYIQAKKMKVIPGDKVVTGPFNLVIGDVPTPLGFLFGFFPTPNKSRGSGVIIPTFGQAADRGYYLTNGGYYFAPNDYIGVRLTGDIYAGNGQVTPGGWGATADISYLKRYTYQGGFNFRFSNRPSNQLVPTDALSTNPVYIRPPSANSFWITWNHTPVPKPGGGRFSASVNAGTSSFNRINSLDARRFLSTQFSSSISYSKQIRNSPINYDIRLSQSQGTEGTMAFTLPDVSVGVARQYPYQWFGIKPGGKYGAFYEQFTISYNLTARNEISNTVAPRTLGNGLPLLGGTTTPTNIPLNINNIGKLLLNARNGMQHQFGIGLGSYHLGPHIQLSPSVSYGEVWYAQRLNYRFSPVAQAVRIDTTYGLNRINSYSGSVSLNTTFYGTVVRKGTHKIQAIRHKATPSLNYSYSPPLNARSNVNPSGSSILTAPNSVSGGVPVPLLRDQFNEFVTDPRLLNQYTFNNYNNFLYGVPGGARASQVSFNLQNSVEMKVRDSNDTTGLNPFRKASLIDGLDFNIGYNFAADSLKLSPLGVNFRTQVAKKLNLNSSASFEPYQRDSQGRPINKYLFQANRPRLMRLASASLGATYAFNPATGKRKSVVPRAVAPSNDPTLGTVGPANYYADYIDFDIPWQLSLTYAAGYTTNSIPLKKGQDTPPILALHTIGATGSVKLTPNLQLTYNLGYDITHQTVTYPNVTFVRDLHCWQITGSWIPFGITKGYNFTIAAKSSLLQDLKLNRNRYAQYQ